MNSDNTGAFVPDEVFGNWNSMDADEKIRILTNPSPETIAALTEFLKEFNKPSERVTDFRESRHDALIELLLKGGLSFDEKVVIIDYIDKGIKEAAEAKDKDKNVNIKALVVIGGILSIITGSAVAAKIDKKAGTALIAAGSAALLGAGASDTKIGKALIEYLSDTQNEEVVEV